MTKAEAKAINESASRAIRVLNQVDLSTIPGVANVPMEIRAEMFNSYKGALDEIMRINDMALEELRGK